MMLRKKIDFKLFFKSLEQKFECLQLRFDEVNERIYKVESNSQKQLPLKALNLQQRGRNSYRCADEDDYREDLDREDRAPYINLSRFGRKTENREVRYRD